MSWIERFGPGRTRRPRWLAVMVVAGLVVSARAQQPPVFRSAVDLVPLDLVVLDQEGRPVAGLQPADFRVTVDGQPRKVVTAQFLSSAASGASSPSDVIPAAKGWNADDAFDTTYVGNDRAVGGATATPARTIVIAIDQSTFGMAAGRSAAAAAAGLLALLHPNDRVGLSVYPPPGPTVRPTRDHARVRQALNQVTGTAEPLPRTDVSLTLTDALAWSAGSMSQSQVLSRVCAANNVEPCRQQVEEAANQIVQHVQRQTRVSLEGLRTVIQGAVSDGSPATVVVVSTGLYGGGAAGQLGLDEELRAVGRVAAASRARLYALYVESGFLDQDSMERRVTGFSTSDGDLRLGGLRDLAGVSGGSLVRVGTGSDTSFRQVSLELSAYYLLGIESLPADRDGNRHRVRVRAERPGLTVRTAEDLYIPAAKRWVGDDAVREALKGVQLENGLPLRLSTQMMREAGTDKVRLVISAQIDRGVVTPMPVRLGYSIRGVGTAATAGRTEVQKLNLPVVGTGADAALSYVETASLTPGRYLLRFAAADEAGRVGSVQQVIDALLVGGDGAVFSDLLIVDPSRVAKGGFTPVADGRITSGVLEAFLEIYPGERQQVGSVVFEVSDGPGGPALVGGSVTPEKKDSDRLSAGINLQLGALPPGAYVLSARVIGGGRTFGRLSRPFRVDRPVGAGASPRATLSFSASGGVVKDFAREDALRPDAVQFFLGRLRAADAAATGSALSAAAEAVRDSRFDVAMAALEGESSDGLSATFLKGLALFGLGRLEPAAAQFRTALRLSNDFLPAAFYLGACYAAGGHDREAVGAWQTSLVSETDARIVYEVLADALLRLKDGAQAEAIIVEAQGHWPGDDVFAPRLAAAHVIRDRRAAALEELARYIERHPGDAEPLFLAIRLLYEAYDSGKPLMGRTEDRAAVEKYGALYRAAGGANQALASRWVAAMTKNGSKP